MRRRPRDTLLGRGHVSLLPIPRPVPRGPPTDQQLPASRDPLSPPHRLESAWRCLPWLRPLPGPWWFNGSLLLGQQICKPQVSSISLVKKKRKENYLTKCYLCLPNPSWPQGLAAAQDPRASGFLDSSPGRGSGVPSGEQTQPGVACCPSTRTQRPGQRQPKGVWLSWVGQEVTLHPPPDPRHGRSPWAAASLCWGSRNRH